MSLSAGSGWASGSGWGSGSGSVSGPTTQTAYDPLGRVAKTCDALGHVTGYAYSYISLGGGLYGSETTTTLPDPDGSGPLSAPTTTDDYDAAGNLVRHVHAWAISPPTNTTTSAAWSSRPIPTPTAPAPRPPRSRPTRMIKTGISYPRRTHFRKRRTTSMTPGIASSKRPIPPRASRRTRMTRSAIS